MTLVDEVSKRSEHVGVVRSVNIGLPRDVGWRGKLVHTGIWKHPVAGPVRLRRTNLDGDGQGDLAGHGGEHRAVLVYQWESYAYWAGVLDREDLARDPEPGQFGENLTVDGLPDDVVCIGDRFRIGTALVEVTQPRVTCYRVGLRLGEPRMAALLVQHHRPGFYLRVLDEGELTAGDEVIRVGRSDPAMTVAAVDALLYLPNRSRAELERAVRIPALSEGWRQSFRDLLAASPSPIPPPAWQGFRGLRITDLRREADAVVSVSLQDPEGAPLPPFRAGQYVTLRVPVADGTAVRSYSLSSAPGAPAYRVSVKREPYGVGSAAVHTRFTVGDLIEVAAPAGSFVLDEGEGPVLLVSAGIGVTPVLSMLYALAAVPSRRRIVWAHAARTPATDALAAETAALLRALPDAAGHVFYSGGPPDGAVRPDGVVAVHVGRLTPLELAALVPGAGTTAYVCGPGEFMASVRRTLAGVGLPEDAIRSETFGAAPAINPGVIPHARPRTVPAQDGPGPLVVFGRSGVTARWSPACHSLLELAEAAGVATRWACRTGVCHTCETSLLSGSTAYDPEPLEEPMAGRVLLCCSRPVDDVLLDA